MQAFVILLTACDISIISFRQEITEGLPICQAKIARQVGVNISSIIRSIEKAERRGTNGKHY
jgi:hypothetical protein